MRKDRKPFHAPLRTALADVVVAGQRLRADETISVATLNLGYAAKRRQMTRGAR